MSALPTAAPQQPVRRTEADLRAALGSVCWSAVAERLSQSVQEPLGLRRLRLEAARRLESLAEGTAPWPDNLRGYRAQMAGNLIQAAVQRAQEVLAVPAVVKASSATAVTGAAEPAEAEACEPEAKQTFPSPDLQAWAQAGLVVAPARLWWQQHPELAAPFVPAEGQGWGWGQAAPGGGEALGGPGLWSLLHAILWEDGYVIQVPQGADAGSVLRLPAPAARPGAWVSHFIRVGEGANLQLVDESLFPLLAGSGRPGPGNPAAGTQMASLAVWMWLGRRAQLDYTSAVAGPGPHAVGRQARLAEGARVGLNLLSLGGRRLEEVRLEMEGEDGQSRLTWLVAGREGTLLTLHPQVVHRGRHTQSHVVVRTAAGAQAHVDMPAATYIRQGAAGARGYQRLQSLLLSPQAQVEALPGLYIDENDVDAGHAATASQFDEEQLYYLQSRGIPREQAEELLLSGFFAPLLDEWQPAALRERATRLLKDFWQPAPAAGSAGPAASMAKEGC